MEKRLFLAFALSLLVLFGWSKFFPPDPGSQQFLSEPEISERKSDTPQLKDTASTQPLSDEQNPSDFEEQTRSLENPFLRLEFSNRGGQLKAIHFTRYDYELPLTSVGSVVAWRSQEFRLAEETPDHVVYVLQAAELEIRKAYRIIDDYQVEETVTIINRTPQEALLDLAIVAYKLDMSSLDKKEELGDPHARDKSLFEYAIRTEDGIERKGGAFKFSSKEAREEVGSVSWMAFRDRYFSLIFDPQFDVYGYAIQPVDEQTQDLVLNLRGITLPAGGEREFVTRIYIGPEESGILASVDPTYGELKKYYRFGLFDVVAKFIYRIMHFIHRIVPNWGMVIILLSVLIYFSMYPLTLRGMMSMRKMQLLQPKIAQLKVKYPDNPQKLNKEMLELYKKERINPLGGCLPFLLQMPVFIGLYQVLWRSVALKGADFLWIKDLSEPDRLFIMPFTIPFLGNEFNLLPLLMMVIMYWQQKLTQKNMISATPEQATQQKIMARVMPLFLGFIFYKFASGLTLYFTMFYTFSTFTQWKMSKLGNSE